MSRCQAITNLINSVAKEQEALADILSTLKGHDFTPGFGTSNGGFNDSNLAIIPGKDDKIEKQIQLVNAVSRLDLVLTTKLSLFLDCACPNDGCEEDEGHKI